MKLLILKHIKRQFLYLLFPFLYFLCFSIIARSYIVLLFRECQYHFSHFRDGEMEAQKGEVTCPRSHSEPMAELGVEPRPPESQSSFLATS